MVKVSKDTAEKITKIIVYLAQKNEPVQQKEIYNIFTKNSFARKNVHSIPFIHNIKRYEPILKRYITIKREVKPSYRKKIVNGKEHIEERESKPCYWFLNKNLLMKRNKKGVLRLYILIKTLRLQSKGNRDYWKEFRKSSFFTEELLIEYAEETGRINTQFKKQTGIIIDRVKNLTLRENPSKIKIKQLRKQWIATFDRCFENSFE